MPFQSEKQRRFLHANHPEIAKRWERDYANGGILDITGDEEITTDDGNDIELTDYNAAFDDPTDLSTGVKTLFQAKDGGGTPQLAKKSKDGKRPGYAGEDWDWSGLDSPASGPAGGQSSGGNYDGGQQHHANEFAGITQGTGSGQLHANEFVEAQDRIIELQERDRKKARKDLVETGPGSDVEKYDTWEQKFQDIPGALDFKSPQHNPYKSKTNVDYTKSVYEESLANQKAKLKSWGLQQLIPLGIMIAMGVPLNLALKAFPKTISLSKNDIITLVKHSLPVAKAKKEYIAALENHKGGLLGQVDINNPNEMKSKIGTQISDITNEINNLTKTPDDDDTGGDGPVLPPQLGGPSTEEMATEYQDDWYGAIKEKQAQQKAFKEKIESEKLAREGNPIVSGTETDIIALRNSGGLANLFRVKNQ